MRLMVTCEQTFFFLTVEGSTVFPPAVKKQNAWLQVRLPVIGICNLPVTEFGSVKLSFVNETTGKIEKKNNV